MFFPQSERLKWQWMGVTVTVTQVWVIRKTVLVFPIYLVSISFILKTWGFHRPIMDIVNFYKNIHSYQIGYRLSQWSFNYCIFSASIFGLTGLKSKGGIRKKSTVITIEKPTNNDQQKFDLSKFLPLECQSCNRRFPNEAILQWHISTQHESTGKFF